MYRVLYRKWRPRVFADVIGQPQVTKTLSAQIKDNRLSHAYLFTGSRGTGKTTCAKILAKAVNCLHPVNGDPCNECEICRGIDNGTVLDIVEIDAASNRGIDDIRLLRDEVSFAPSQAQYRVYIIDEVHMLTIEAFNALLKTLEEPPEHVKFILATTEVHKLPSTILSRCQRFDFRRIEPASIADRLLYVAQEENAALDYDAAVLIARIADGGMRDALSLLDRCLSVDTNVTTEVVSASAGLMSREYIYDLMDAIAAKDTARCLSILDELHKASCDTERLCTELIDRFRSFLIIKTVAHPENLIICTAEELERIKQSAAAFTEEQVLYSLNVLAAATDAIRRTQNRRIEAEMALIRLCRPDTDDSAAALAARVAELEKELAELKRNGGTVCRATGGSTAGSKPEMGSGTVCRATGGDAAGSKPETDGGTVCRATGEGITGSKQKTEGGTVCRVTGEADVFPAEPPFPEEPPFEPDVPETAQTTDFSGFGAEKPSQGGFAAQFAQADDGEDDDEPFDFDAFMNEHAGHAKNGQPADDAGEDIPPFPGEFDAPPEENEAMPFDVPEEQPRKRAVPIPEETGGEQVDPKVWMKIIYGTEKKFPPLIGALTDSSAFIAGNTLTIRFAEKNVLLFINKDYLSRYASEAAFEVLGKKYNIKTE